MIDVISSVIMVMLAITVQIFALRWFFRRLVKPIPPRSLEPVEDGTQQFIEDMDERLNSPDLWRWVP